MATKKMPNRLANETSPYLLQHSHNPVDWHPWGEAALERARAEQKPILLSIGYSACHWCHVMERESFENEAIAALMNERFVCVKVDREERPDLDHLYMTAVQAMAGQGGWPLTVFLTPEGEPFFGGTYYPPVDLHGRPGFPRVLKAVSDAWTERRSSVLEQSADMVRFIRRSSEAALPPAPVTPDLFSTAFRQLRQAYDRRHGGFGGAPKFPQPMLIDFLLRHHLGTGSQDALEMAVKTLESMALGGIRDQLGGGFHRYSTDERWLVPHFEKMLYDNAQLAQSYLRAWQVTGRPLFRRVAEETLDYVRREMTSPFGGFYSAQDADSEGEEGRFFVWTVEEIEQELGEDAAGFCRRYGVEPGGNWEGKSILTMSDHSDDSDPLDAELQSGRERLFAARERRVRPFRDEKVLASWNGLMLAAFAEAGAVLGRADYLQTARNNAEFLLRELAVSSEDGGLKLLRTGKATFVENPADPAGRSETFRAGPIPGFLDDYAHLADALLHLYQATGEAKWLQGASALAKTIVADFSGPDGAFYLTPSGGEELIGRPRDVTDNAIPSGNSVALEVLLKLSGILGNTEMERIASRILRSLRGLMERNPLAFGRLLGVADLYVLPRRQLVVAGEEQGGETLLAVARETYRPNLFVVPCGSQGGAAVAESKSAIAGRAAAYLCQDGTCRAPILEPQELREALANP